MKTLELEGSRLAAYEYSMNTKAARHLIKLALEMQLVSSNRTHELYRLLDNIDPMEINGNTRRNIAGIMSTLDTTELTPDFVKSVEDEWDSLPVRFDKEMQAWVPVDDGDYHETDIVARLNLSIANSMGGGLVIRPFGHPRTAKE